MSKPMTAQEALQASIQGTTALQQHHDAEAEECISAAAAVGRTLIVDPGVSCAKKAELEARGFRVEDEGWLPTIEWGPQPQPQPWWRKLFGHK